MGEVPLYRYFTLLANLEWTPNTLASGKFQYKVVPPPS